MSIERQKGVVEAARRRSYDIILILKQENKYRGKSFFFIGIINFFVQAFFIVI